jgi:serine/threonine-protein kinase RsbW
MTLCLPRDALSVPVARRVCRHALETIGAAPSCTSDIELAITEACANVLNHSAADHEYKVDVQIDDTHCRIRVTDSGRGFDYSSLEPGHGLDLTAESGRGISLITSLVDTAHFESREEEGTIVSLEKKLDYSEGAPIERLRTRRRAGAASGGGLELDGDR